MEWKEGVGGFFVFTVRIRRFLGLWFGRGVCGVVALERGVLFMKERRRKSADVVRIVCTPLCKLI